MVRQRGGDWKTGGKGGYRFINRDKEKRNSKGASKRGSGACKRNVIKSLTKKRKKEFPLKDMPGGK